MEKCGDMMSQSDPRIVLDTPIGDNDANADTIRGYLITLLAALWDEGEQSNAKRPFGNSGWHGELYAALAQAGHIHGTVDKHGYIDNVDTHTGNLLIKDAIRTLAGPATDAAPI